MKERLKKEQKNKSSSPNKTSIFLQEYAKWPAYIRKEVEIEMDIHRFAKKRPV